MVNFTFLSTRKSFILVFLFASLGLFAQTITTDKVDYFPGDEVLVSGKGWGSFEVIDLKLEEHVFNNLGDSGLMDVVTADASGSFSTEIYTVVEADRGAFFHLLATGRTSQHEATITFNDAGGDYGIDFSAYDPTVYERYLNGEVTAPNGRGASPLGTTSHGSTVESLQPSDLGLGQIVAFEYFVRADAGGVCEDDTISIGGEWLTETTNGGAFGFDGNLKVIGAFVDTGADASLIDTGEFASVSNFTSNLVGNTIESTVEVSGMDPGDEIIVEVWLVLQSSIPQSIGGNVKTRLGDAATIGICESGKINTGNQEVPLNRVGEFFTADVDISVTKTDDVDPIDLGGTLTYTITATNVLGSAVANNVVITDTLDPNVSFVSASDGGTHNTGVVTWDVGVLEPGETVIYTVTVTVNGDAPTDDTTATQCGTGDIGNLVTIATISDDTNPANDTDCELTDVNFPANPSLTIVKDVDLATISAPGTLTYTITVDNTGDVDLTNVVLTDVFAGGATLTSGDLNTNSILETTETWIYTATYDVTQADINAGTPLVNTAIVDTDQTDPAEDDATTTIDAAPSLTIVKDVDLATISAPGTLTYTITVDNTGDVDLTNVVLTDVFAGGATLTSGDLNTNSILETTETWIYTATYDVTQADINAGTPLVNTAIVDTDQTDPAEDDATTTIDAAPSLTIVKDVDLATISAPGTLTYTITVDNTGDVDLTNVVLTDVFAGGATLTSGDLNTNSILETTETWIYTATYDVTQADINAGTPLVNTAIVDTDQTDPAEDDATTTIDAAPSLTIVKDVDLATISAPGTLTYTITVDNTGDVDLTNVVLTDVFAGGATLTSGDLNTNSILETTETWIYTATYDVTQADINAGTPLVNTAIVDTDQTDPAEDDATTTIDAAPSLTIVKDVDLATISAPGTLTYTITVDNTGDVDLTNVVLTDVFAGGATLTSGDLNTNSILETTETWIYTATYDVTQADINAGTPLVNTAIVDTDQTDPAEDDATTTIDAAPSLTIVKDVDLATISAPGTLTYTITVDNTGDVDLTNVVLTDVFAGGATLTSGDLNTNSILETTETWIYTATYDVTQADINAGTPLVNTAIVDTDQTDPAEDDATTTIDAAPSLTIVKDVDLATISAPGTLTYTITVDNTGDVDLTNVVLTDVFAGGATLTSGDLNTNSILETTETWIYTATYDVTQADINAGTPLVNTAIVDTDQTDPAEDDATTTIDAAPSLTIVKDVDLATISAPGTLTYTITVDNTGDVDLTNVVLTDVFAGGATLTSGDLNTNSILETTETWIYTATYDVTQADINAGTPLVNTAIVDTDQTDPAEDDATTTIDAAPSLTIVKDVDLATISAPGTLTYTITVDNTGDVDLTNVVLTDVFAGGATLTSGDLNTNSILETTETWIYTATYDVTQADINAGTPLVNTAIVDTDQTDPAEDDATTTIDAAPSLTIVKDVDLATISAPGTLTYTITVDNTGDVDLTNVVLTDVFAGGATLTSGDLNTNSILETTETWIYTATYDVTQADINAGTPLVNTAIVDTDQTDPAEDDATTTIDAAPSLTIVKDVDLATISAPGTLTYTITVDNTGDVDLTNVVLTDVFAGGATLTSGDLNTNSILETTETWIYTATYDVTQADINAGTPLVNTAIVDTDQTDPAEDDATTTIDAAPSLTIVKDVDLATISAPGTLTYTITVDNTGDVDLTNVVLTDVFAGGATLTSGDLNTNSILETTETWIYTATYDVTQADINAGTPLVNTAIVDTDQTDPAEDDATTTIDAAPSLTIVKDVDLATISAPGTLTYTITVDNTGDVDLTNVVLTDVFAGGATLTSGDLNTNSILETTETWIYTATYDVTQADINAGTPLVNTAIVDTDQTDPAEDDATTTIDAAPSLTIVKDVDLATISAPGTLTYTITVDNTGDVDLTNVVLTDVFAGGATLTSGDLNTNSILETTETWIYTATYDVTQADINAGTPLVNTAIVDTDQTDPAEDDATTTIDAAPSLTIVKDVDLATISAPGTLTYTITVDNTGDVDLTNVVLTDVFAGGATLTSGDLNTNSILETTETWIYTATYDVTQADINAGTPLVNTAIVDTDQTDPAEDDATTTIDAAPSLTIVKDVDLATISAPGTLTYTITVDNTGDVDLTNVVLTDVFAGGATLTSGDLNTNSILETTETWIYTATYDVTQADINAGTPLVNTAIVDTDQTDPAEDDATTTIDAAPSLTIVKDVDLATISAPGTLTYTITVDNTGDVDLTNVVLTDVFAGGATLTSGDLNTNSILETTETWIYTATYDVTQADINAGTPLVNTAIVDTDQTDPAEDDATTTIDAAPSLTIVKDVDLATISAPGTLTYTITVDNTGDVDLTNVVLTDVFAGGATLTSGDLNTNSILETTETWIYTATYDVTQADINAGTPLVNTAIVDTDQTDPAEDDATTLIFKCQVVQDKELLCFGENNGIATATPIGGVGPFTYAWDNGNTNATADDLTAGVHTVTITDGNGKTSTCSVLINGPTEALSCSIDQEVLTTNHQTPDGVATVSVTGGSGQYTYLWDNGETTQTATTLTYGMHSVTVTDSNGCETTCQIDIAKELYCWTNLIQNVSYNGGNDGSARVTGNGGYRPYTFEWEDGSTGEVNSSLSAGTHDVTITDAKGATSVCSVTISEPNDGNCTDLTCSIDQDVLATNHQTPDGVATVSVTGGSGQYKYLWDNGETTQTATTLTYGIHSVTVTDSNGCETSCQIDVAKELYCWTNLIQNVSYNGGNDGSARVSGNGGYRPYTFEWEDGSTGEVNSSLSAGTHYVTITDAKGATSVCSVTISEPNDGNCTDLTCSIDQEVLTTNHQTPDGVATVSVTGGSGQYTYLWDNGETTQTATTLTYGMHSVTVTDSNGCETTCQIDIAKELYCWTNLIQNVSYNGGNDGSARVTGNGGYRPYTFEWEDGSTGEVNSSLSAGTHYVTITDAKGATSVCSVTITEPNEEVCDGLDNDGDGYVDEGFDQDGDGIADCFDICPSGDDNMDSDGDGIPDSCDQEECDGVDNDGDGDIDEGFDQDGDGISDCDDICEGGDDNMDSDGDGTPDFCDTCDDDADDDGDGVKNCDDICEGGDDNMDSDGDGTPDFCDTCDDDADDDGDGVKNCDDICEGGDDNMDSDGDGTPDFCDTCDDDADDDGDGVKNCDDICEGGDDNMDSDGDGTPDFCDTCDDDADDDGDGVKNCDDICEGGDDNMDSDGDGTPDFCDTCDDDADDDGDGVKNCDDICDGGDDNMDSDGDGIPDGCDVEECDGVDNNGDGQIDEGLDCSTDPVDGCETAFAYYSENSACFLDDDTLKSNRWGWTNYFAQEGNYTMDLYSGAGQCDLSKGVKSGDVNVSYVNGSVSISIDLLPGFVMNEVQIYVGDEKYPLNNGKPTVAPGQYPFVDEDLNNATAYDFGPIDVSSTGGIYVIVHAVTCATSNDSAKFNGNTKVTAFPTIFNNELTVQVESAYASPVNVEMYDMNGRLVVHKKGGQVGIGTNQIMLNVGNLAPDMYIVILKTNREKFIRKVISKK